jgi:hypothetical protein
MDAPQLLLIPRQLSAVWLTANEVPLSHPPTEGHPTVQRCAGFGLGHNTPSAQRHLLRRIHRGNHPCTTGDVPRQGYLGDAILALY